jgi:sodium-independent sulfate anion transporter 11
MAFFKRFRDGVANDHTIKRTSQLGSKALLAFPSASSTYLLDKVPVVHWLPRYNPAWLLNDLLAGITIGVMLIPQSLAYAKIATIPGEYGLMSSWFPNFLYFIMGTSKGEKPFTSKKTTANDLLQICQLAQRHSWVF